MDLSAVTSALGAVALERIRDGWFVRASAAPPWWRSRITDAPGELLDIQQLFPFLSAFLPQAERAWRGGPVAPVGSDMWTEVDSGGRELHLEAFATRAGDTAALVIARNDQAFAERQLLLQRARELRQTYDRLMSEIERKDILLHTIVHDLAAPLHSVLGAVSLLREMELPASAMRWTQIASAAATRQRDLIRGILDAFVGEQGAAAATQSQRIDIVRVVQRAISEREPVARQRQVKLVVQAADSVSVIADDTRMIRVLTNLLDNAIRHAPTGTSVRLTTLIEGGDLLLTIEDEGSGVHPDVMPRLFQKLARDPRGSGTGLGLYFCRITIEQWGGGIGYEPRPDGGARFWVRLPIAAVDSAPPRMVSHG